MLPGMPKAACEHAMANPMLTAHHCSGTWNALPCAGRQEAQGEVCSSSSRCMPKYQLEACDSQARWVSGRPEV